MSREIINPNVKRIILHIGLHKTGTSSIQRSFFRATDVLKAHGILYPTSWVSPNQWSAQHNHFLYLLFKEDLTHYILSFGFNAEEIAEERETGKVKLMQELRETDAHTIVISSENVSLFENKDLQNIHDFFAQHFDATVDVYIYTRHYVDWTRSMLQQLVRQHHTYDAAWNYISKHAAVVYTTIYDRCAQIFGITHTHLLTYEQLKAHPDGLVAGFCADMQLDVDTSQLPKLFINQSMTQFAIEICDYISRHEPFHINNEINPKRSLVDNYPVTTIRGPRFEIPTAMMTKIDEFFAAYVVTLYEQFGIDYRTSHTQVNSVTTYDALDTVFYESLTKAYTGSNSVIRDLIGRYLRHAADHETRLSAGDRQRFIQLIPELEAIPEKTA